MQKADFKSFTNEDYKAITKLEDRYTEAKQIAKVSNNGKNNAI